MLSDYNDNPTTNNDRHQFDLESPPLDLTASFEYCRGQPLRWPPV